jgi:hypothetical protein
MKTHLRTISSGSLAIFLLLLSVSAGAQYKISGTVMDNRNKPVRGASVYLDNTIDGGTSDSLGVFSFTTSEKGNQTIIASEVSHSNAGLPIVIEGDVTGIVLTMKANMAKDLDAVVITAGSFDATNDKTKTVLKPLDIVTTAGSNADPVKAMQMLPGTQQSGADNGLFVRGGDASEAAIIVDGMVVQSAFMSGPPGVSTRSRFGAFQYQGVSFSSGGYSSRYGQALSGVLELNTTDLADKSNVNLGISTGGIYASGVKKWKKSALEFGGGYLNLTPFYKIATTNFDFYKVPVGGNGNLRYVWQPNKNGLFKASFNSSYTSSGITTPNPGQMDTSSYNPFRLMGNNINFVTKDAYYFSNISYNQMFKNKYRLYMAASFSLDNTQTEFLPVTSDQKEHREQFRIEGKDYFTSRLNLVVGTDVQRFGMIRNIDIDKPGIPSLKQDFTETIISGYTELEWTPINRVAIRPGVRYEHSVLLNTDMVAPRISMAIKTGAHSQASLASGIFYQEAGSPYLLAGYKPGMQQATHYIANWQWSADSRTLRVEGYYKKYEQLLLENATTYVFNPYRNITPGLTGMNNLGFGYAQGLELFWRDKKSVKNLDYWISYSYIDTKRKYLNYPVEATPTFIADHNLSVVGKYFVDKWKTNFSLTYSYASGRPYYNPQVTNTNNNGDYSTFLSEKTPEFHNLALTVAYLHSFGKWFTVFYVSLDNITNQHNVFGYRFTPDANGQYQKSPIVPPLYRAIFFGVNASLSQFKKDEL